MNLLERLRRTDLPNPTGVPDIKDWRVHLVERHTVDASIRRGIFGGPYNPPALKNQGEAEVFIQWSDGRSTQATLNRTQLARADESLHALHGQAYLEPYPEMVPGPNEPADVRVCVPEVRDAILSDPTALMAPIHRMESELRLLDTDQVRGHLSAQYARITLASSAGLFSTHETTRISYGAVLASRAWFSHELRDLPEEHMVASRLERVRRDLELLAGSYHESLESATVVLSPGVVSQFLNTFLLNNLSMQAILNGTSAFTRADLEEQRQLFDPNLQILDAPGRDDHHAAYRLDGRGLTPQDRPLIQNGRLVGADVSLRAATQGNLAPTPLSLTDNWLLGEDVMSASEPDAEIDPSDLERCLAGVDNAVYVYSVLGMHTQDPTRGAYSLGVPRALVVRDGRIRGAVRGTLVGNFFDDLKHPLDAIVDPLTHTPMMAVRGTFIKAS